MSNSTEGIAAKIGIGPKAILAGLGTCVGWDFLALRALIETGGVVLKIAKPLHQRDSLFA